MTFITGQVDQFTQGITTQQLENLSLSPEGEKAIRGLVDEMADRLPEIMVDADQDSHRITEVAENLEFLFGGLGAIAVSMALYELGGEIYAEAIAKVMAITWPVFVADLIIKLVPYKHFGRCDVVRQVCVSRHTHHGIDHNGQINDWVTTSEKGCSGHHRCNNHGDICGWRAISPHKSVCNWNRREAWKRYTKKGPLRETHQEMRHKGSNSLRERWHVSHKEKKRRKQWKKIMNGDKHELEKYKVYLSKHVTRYVKAAQKSVKKFAHHVEKRRVHGCKKIHRKWCPELKACCPE
ncbi:hypothetical protein BDZ85DRAFT_268124 [Elsinoe ampelina]|uniref:Uncharacterized protein n=1 Tax=Elsinoe ampelina TaxID=302913 RepID=A0A6A6G224_9PEZI|nr:hypothetical protein BDZ85DRAFT_268124 [Elsinoe ampelina]